MHPSAPDQQVLSALEQHLQQLARFDADTGFLTYEAFFNAVNTAITHNNGRPAALIELRVKGLSRIGGAHGRTAVGFIIRQLAERLLHANLPDAIIGRIDHKTFGIFLSKIEDAVQVLQTTKALIAICARSFKWKDYVLSVEAHAGIGLIDKDCSEAGMLLYNAGLALRTSAEPGNPGYAFFNPEDARIDRRKNDLIAIITAAVEEKQFELVYQPFFEFKTGKLAGFEALLRLRHPSFGQISPAEFIPIAEEVGLINKLGGWVLEEACQTASTWPSHLRVAVNFSPAQFYSGTLLADVNRALERCSFPAYRLEVEITEGTILTEQELVLSQLTALSNMGCPIALDDFGTGYSSLAYLWRFPFSKLKIDRAFIRALDTTPKAPSILKSIMDLSRNLGLEVTAEGIETVEQMETLRALKCDYLQGYLCGKPTAKADLAAIILKNFADQLVPKETAAEPQPERNLLLYRANLG